MMNMWLDGMLGLVVGDALGVPVQFMKRRDIQNRWQGPVTNMESGGVYDKPAGTWSDDSSMALATLDSLCEYHGYHADDIMQKYVYWMYEGLYTPEGASFDVGITCHEAIAKYAQGTSWKDCGKTGEYANGNGALMRVLPLCLWYGALQKAGKTDTESCIRVIQEAGALTHNHARSHMSCGLYYFMVRQLLEDGAKSTKLLGLLQKGLSEGFAFYANRPEGQQEGEHFHRVRELTQLKALTEKDIRSTGYVIDTLEAVLWCLVTTDTYEACMCKAVNLGDDTDTVAAIAGGLAGLYYGCESIPQSWLEVIKRKAWLMELCAEADEILKKEISA